MNQLEKEVEELRKRLKVTIRVAQCGNKFFASRTFSTTTPAFSYQDQRPDSIIFRLSQREGETVSEFEERVRCVARRHGIKHIENLDLDE